MLIALDGSLLGARFSGVERSVAQLVNHLPAAGGADDRVALFVGRAFDDYVARYLTSGLDERVEVIRCEFDNTHKAGRLWWQQVVLPRLVHGLGADVFHAPAYVCPALMATPHVVTLYDLIAFERPEFCTPANRWHYRFAVPAGVRRAQRVLVPSAFTRRAVAAWLPGAHDRTVVVPLGIEDRFAAAPGPDDAAIRNNYRLPDEYLLWVGNIEPKKNVGLLLEMMRELVRRGIDPPRLVIAGELSWGTTEVMRRFLAANLQTRVLFLGRVRDEDLPAVYRGAAAFCFPSLHEGFGLPPLEAMAAGVPVLAADAGALPEVVGDAGLLLPPTDPTAWADALAALLADPARRAALVAAGRERAAGYTWAATAEQVWSVYRAAAAVGEDDYDPRTGHLRWAGS